MKFRKKPVVIEAVRFDDAFVDGDVPEWMADAVFVDETVVSFEDPNRLDTLLVTTLEGVMRAEWGDWIIRGVKGELYPCKPDIFEATYEAVE